MKKWSKRKEKQKNIEDMKMPVGCNINTIQNTCLVGNISTSCVSVCECECECESEFNYASLQSCYTNSPSSSKLSFSFSLLAVFFSEFPRFK